MRTLTPRKPTWWPKAKARRGRSRCSRRLEVALAVQARSRLQAEASRPRSCRCPHGSCSNCRIRPTGGNAGCGLRAGRRRSGDALWLGSLPRRAGAFVGMTGFARPAPPMHCTSTSASPRPPSLPRPSRAFVRIVTGDSPMHKSSFSTARRFAGDQHTEAGLRKRARHFRRDITGGSRRAHRRCRHRDHEQGPRTRRGDRVRHPACE